MGSGGQSDCSLSLRGSRSAQGELSKLRLLCAHLAPLFTIMLWPPQGCCKKNGLSGGGGDSGVAMKLGPGPTLPH